MFRQCNLVFALAALTLFPPAAGAADADAGRKLSVTHCARCHVIPGLNNFGIGSTPSFKIMVRSRSEDWRNKFEAFYTLPPHGNFVRVKGVPPLTDLPAIVAPIDLVPDDIDDLMAYVDKLAGEYRK